jgi:aminopeptidase N
MFQFGCHCQGNDQLLTCLLQQAQESSANQHDDRRGVDNRHLSHAQAHASDLVVGLFPVLLADEATLRAADDWLDKNPQAAPALRRLVSEGRDGVARALRAQARDARD